MPARFFLERGYKFKSDYVAEHYKELLDLFEKKYRFTINLDLTVEKEDLVPGWDDLKKNSFQSSFTREGF